MLYITDIDAPWVGYTQAALQYQMALLTAGFERWHMIPLRGAQNVRRETSAMQDPASGEQISVPTMVGEAVQYSTLPSWCQKIRDPRMTPPVGSPEWHQRVRPVRGYDLGFIHHTPDNISIPELRRGRKANIGFTVTETNRVPRWLAEQMSELDAIVTATEWNKQMFVESGVDVPIHVLPHTLGDYWLAPHPTDGVENEAYIFYYVGTWNERKNPADVVRAYLRAFPENDGKTALMLKLHFTKGQERMLKAIIENETGSDARVNGEDADIWVYDQKFKWDEMRALHALGDCYVSLHRGEGWGYGLHQAAAIGNPVIYTDWSAPAEFMPNFPEVALPVPVAQLAAAQGASNVPYFQTMPGEAPLMWAQPDIEAAVAQMRAAFAARGRGPVQNPFDWETVGAQFVSIIDQYETDPYETGGSSCQPTPGVVRGAGRNSSIMDRRVYSLRGGGEAVVWLRKDTTDYNTHHAVLVDDEYMLSVLAKPGGVLVDIGAHTGATTLFGALRGMHVVCVEPLPENQQLIEAHISQNGVKDRVQLLKGAVGPGEVVRVWYGDTSVPTTAIDQFMGRPALHPVNSDPDAWVDAAAFSLEAILTGIPNRVDILKLDCEGGEWWGVGTAASEIWDKVDIVLAELHFAVPQATSRRAFIKCFAPHLVEVPEYGLALPGHERLQHVMLRHRNRELTTDERQRLVDIHQQFAPHRAQVGSLSVES